MAAPTLADRIPGFLANLDITARLPKHVQVLNPYRDPDTFALCKQFYRKYYNDNRSRVLLLGINPGRFGSGATGISFTDPVRLEVDCGIHNNLPKKPELSADFIYRMIAAFGGPEKFYARYFISAVSPLGFVRNGVNLNYYDIPKLQAAVQPFIVASIEQMLELGVDRRRCYCIGEGKNLKFLSKLNDEHHWFEEIIPLAHPRFIMQYRRKKIDEYIATYLELLQG